MTDNDRVRISWTPPDTQPISFEDGFKQYSTDGGQTWTPPPARGWWDMDFSTGPRCFCGFPEEIEREHPPSWRPGTPEKEHQRVLYVRAEIATHQAAWESATGLRRAVLDAHGPHIGSRGEPYCEGCDIGCSCDEPADWPCSTYKLAMEAE